MLCSVFPFHYLVFCIVCSALCVHMCVFCCVCVCVCVFCCVCLCVYVLLCVPVSFQHSVQENTPKRALCSGASDQPLRKNILNVGFLGFQCRNFVSEIINILFWFLNFHLYRSSCCGVLSSSFQRRSWQIWDTLSMKEGRQCDLWLCLLIKVLQVFHVQYIFKI